jgi:Mn2+/Fe2+ NRAMP family transporter
VKPKDHDGRVESALPSEPRRGARWSLREIGPELVSAASDNDPTNVGTAVSVGARTAYQLSWVALLVAPLLGIVQVIAAQVGTVAQGDLQSLTIKRYGRRVALLLLLTTVVVNVITTAADLQAGAAGLSLLVGVDSRWLVLPLSLAVCSLLLVGRYRHVMAALRYLLLGFLVFGVAAVLARPDWTRLLRGSFVPSLSLDRRVLSSALALIGTTLTSYVYVWETIERGVEEPPGESVGRLRRIRGGAVLGAVFTAVTLWFMVVASAATLGHRRSVTSARDAAQALEPLLGHASVDLFGIGLLVSALVALPVLLATTAHVLGAQFGWRSGLSEGIRAAPGFYAILVVSVALAVSLSLAQISVVAMLVVASVLGGLGTPLGLVVLVKLARDPVVMKASPISRRLAVAGWTICVLVAGLGLAFVVIAVVA